MARVTLDGIRKVYENGYTAVHGISLDVDEGEFVVLVGPSGCGKSTTLRMIAGLESISEGRLTIGDRVVNDVPARDRDIAMVFQSYALYPHMTVRDNMAFSLNIAKRPKEEVDRKVNEAAEILDLKDHLDRKPANLSGGQRQRVAMGRAIVRNPKAFLMDEPLSNLDAKLRVQMRSEVARIQHELKATTVYVTHDQVEAMTMGDRVALMRRGVLQQVDTPMRLYHAPANLFVASFIGSPSMNLFEAQLERKNGHVTDYRQECIAKAQNMASFLRQHGNVLLPNHQQLRKEDRMQRSSRIQRIQSWHRVRRWHLQRQPWHHWHWWQRYVGQQRHDHGQDHHHHWWKGAAWRHRHWWNWRHWRDT